MSIYYQREGVTLICGDVREQLQAIPKRSVQCVVTSPPYYGLRDYGHDGQIGHESTVEAYVEEMVDVFREVRRVLKDDGVLWLNLGDSYANSGESRPQRDMSGGFGGRHLGTRGEQGYANSSGAGVVRTVPAGLKPKDLIGIPWRVAFALQADGWYLRQDIIWSKPNPMPESVKDRCTKSHEYLFLLTKSPRYYYNAEAIAEPVCMDSSGGWQSRAKRGLLTSREQGFGGNGQESQFRSDGEKSLGRGGVAAPNTDGKRNRRSVWTVATRPYKEAHFAVFPPQLIEPCILAGSREGDVVFDPFAGSGTTLEVAQRLGRNCLGVELNPEYCELIVKRVQQATLPFEIPA